MLGALTSSTSALKSAPATFCTARVVTPLAATRAARAGARARQRRLPEARLLPSAEVVQREVEAAIDVAILDYIFCCFCFVAS